MLIENIKLHYLEVPFLITFMDWMDDPNEKEYYRLHFTIGAAFSRLFNYKVINTKIIDVTEQQSFNKNALSLIGGLTYYLNAHIGVNLQYSKSLTNLQKEEANLVMKGELITVNLLYMF